MPSLSIKGAVRAARTCTAADLRREPATTETVFFSTGRDPVAGSFTGVLLCTLLRDAGIRADPKVKNDILRRTIMVSGADGYVAVFAAGELDPEFGGALVIVAYARDGAPLGRDAGFAHIIVPGDKAGGRDVMDVATIEVR